MAFKTVAESDRAIEEMNGAEINGRAITVERARRMGGHAKTPGRCKWLYLINDHFLYSLYILFLLIAL